MTETEARQFVDRVKELCREYQRDCGCKIELKIHETYKTATKVKFITIESISLLIDK
jgi:hypothetical protein